MPPFLFSQFFVLIFLLPPYAASFKCHISQPNEDLVQIIEFVPMQASQMAGCVIDYCIQCDQEVYDDCHIAIVQRRVFANYDQIEADKKFKTLCGHRRYVITLVNKMITFINENGNMSDEIYDKFGYRVRVPPQIEIQMDGALEENLDWPSSAAKTTQMPPTLLIFAIFGSMLLQMIALQTGQFLHHKQLRNDYEEGGDEESGNDESAKGGGESTSSTENPPSAEGASFLSILIGVVTAMMCAFHFIGWMVNI